MEHRIIACAAVASLCGSTTIGSARQTSGDERLPTVILVMKISVCERFYHNGVSLPRCSQRCFSACTILSCPCHVSLIVGHFTFRDGASDHCMCGRRQPLWIHNYWICRQTSGDQRWPTVIVVMKTSVDDWFFHSGVSLPSCSQRCFSACTIPSCPFLFSSAALQW